MFCDITKSKQLQRGYEKQITCQGTLHVHDAMIPALALFRADGIVRDLFLVRFHLELVFGLVRRLKVLRLSRCPCCYWTASCGGRVL